MPAGFQIFHTSNFDVKKKKETSLCFSFKTKECTKSLSRAFLKSISTIWVRQTSFDNFPKCCWKLKCSLPSDTDVFKTSSRRLKKVTTSYDQTRRRHYVWKKTLDLRRLEGVWFTSSRRRPIYDVLKTSDLWRLEDIWFITFWRRL